MEAYQQYIKDMISDLQTVFGTRLCYVGLQGSYLRGEAHAGSDLDLMVVIDGLSPDDLNLYRACLANRGDGIPSCGFLCGRAELAAWNPLEAAHVLHSTKDFFGTLAPLLPPYTEDDHRRYVQLSLGSFYHALCHRYVHGGEEGRAVSLGRHEKELFFLLQDLHFLRCGVFIPTRAALYDALHPQDRAVWDAVKAAGDHPDAIDFAQAFAEIFAWCQSVLYEISAAN